MAHIVFVTPYYPPEVGAAQVRISETASRLVARGHEVTVLTTLPNYPLGVVPPEYRDGKNRSELRNGVRIERVWSYVSPNKGFLRRILSQLSFGLLSPFLIGKRLGKPDILIVESPPLFDAFVGRILARRFKAPYIFTVADIWPESAVQLGALNNRALIWLAERLEWSTYRRAGAVWSVTVMVAVQVAELPAASFTVNVTTVAPRPTLVVATGLCVTAKLVLQLSAAATSPVRSGIAA